MRNERGFSLIELLIVVAIIGIIAAIAVPNLLQSKAAANEASAISSVRNVITSQITYSATVGSGKYAPNLATLNGAQLIDEILAAGTKDGYTFATTNPTNDTFTVTATPNVFGSTGRRGFYGDESGVIRYTTDGSAPTTANSALGQ